MKKLLALALAIIVVLSTLTGCGAQNASTGSASSNTAAEAASSSGNSDAGEEVESRDYIFACTAALTTDPKGPIVDFCNNQIAEHSGGKFNVTLYDNSTFGTDTEILEGIVNGTVGFHSGDMSASAVLVPETAIFSIPFLLTSDDTCNWAIDKFMDTLNEYFHAKGLHLLTVVNNGFRNISSNKPINVPADLAGLNIRVMNNQYHIAYYTALGANPTPLALPEVYLALQQNMLDAQDCHINMMITSNYAEVQKYFVFTNALPVFDTLAMNYNDYMSMNDTTKALVDEYAASFKQMMIDSVKESTEAYTKQMQEEYGISIVNFTDEQLAEMREMASSSVMDMLRKNVDGDLIDSWVAICDEAESNKEAIIAGSYNG